MNVIQKKIAGQVSNREDKEWLFPPPCTRSRVYRGEKNFVAARWLQGTGSTAERKLRDYVPPAHA